MGDDGWRDMPALMSKQTILALSNALRQLVANQSRPFATVLHGGEPLMLGARRLDFLLSALRQQLPQTHVLCMQTNGMLLTPEIADICARHRVSISISLDGTKDINDRFRLDKRGGSTHARVLAGVSVLQNHAERAFLYSGLLAVVDPTSDPEEIYSYLKGLDAPSIDFLYRDGNHTHLPYGKTSFHSTEYGAWFNQLLTIYLADDHPPRIRFLDDIIKLSLGGRGVKEGLGNTDYGIAIVETDGSISKNDTLKSSFDGADRFSQRWSVHTHALTEILKTSEFAHYHSLQRATSAQCRACPYLSVCGGGMPLHRWKSGSDFDNPSIYCNDQKVLIGSVIMHLRREGLPIDPRLEHSPPATAAVPLQHSAAST